MTARKRITRQRLANSRQTGDLDWMHETVQRIEFEAVASSLDSHGLRISSLCRFVRRRVWYRQRDEPRRM
jgi:hypothetical protein